MLEYRGFSSASQRWGCFTGRFPWFRDDDGTIVGQGIYLSFLCIYLCIPFALLIFAVHSEPIPLRAKEAARHRGKRQAPFHANKCGVVLVLVYNEMKLYY